MSAPLRARTFVAFGSFALMLATGCGARRPQAQVIASKLSDKGAPKCQLPPTEALPKAEWLAREATLEGIGQALGTNEFDEPVVLDALSREVIAITDAGACMPAYAEKPDGTIEYELRCARLDPALKVRADRVEKIVRDDGPKLLKTAAALKCRVGTTMTKYNFSSAAQGSLRGGKATGKAAGCSWGEPASCEAACAVGSLPACAVAVSQVKDDAKRKELVARSCDLALDDPKTSLKDVKTSCQLWGMDMTAEASQKRAMRFADRACTAAETDASCWFTLDAQHPAYRVAFAKDYASRLDCSGEKQCPVGSLIDREAPHYDAARAEALLARLDDTCSRREKACFSLASMAWRALDAAPKKRVAAVALAECEQNGPNAQSACYLALDANRRGGVTEDVNKAAAIATRICDANEVMCTVAGECIAKGTCAHAPDPAAARPFYERTCAAYMKLAPTKPRGEWPACKQADELGASH